MKNQTRLNLKLEEELLNKFKAAAQKKQLSVSALVRLLMIEYLNETKNN